MMEKVVHIFNTGDLSEVDALFSPEYLDHQKPPYISVNGPEEFKQIVVGARKSMVNLKVTIEDFVCEDTKIVARLRWHSSNVDRETIDILHIKNGQFTEHWGAETWSSAKK